MNIERDRIWLDRYTTRLLESNTQCHYDRGEYGAVILTLSRITFLLHPETQRRMYVI